MPNILTFRAIYDSIQIVPDQTKYDVQEISTLRQLYQEWDTAISSGKQTASFRYRLGGCTKRSKPPLEAFKRNGLGNLGDIKFFESSYQALSGL